MGFETKYSIGNKVFFIQENAVHQGIIKRISVYLSSNDYSMQQNEYYDIDSYDKAIYKTYRDVDKSLIYKSKEELLKSL